MADLFVSLLTFAAGMAAGIPVGWFACQVRKIAANLDHIEKQTKGDHERP